MTPSQIDAFCATLPAATRTVQWEGVIVFKVGGKMFCLIAPPDHSIGRVCFKCPPEHYEALSRSDGFRPAPYLARAKWVALDDPSILTPAETEGLYQPRPRRHRRRAAAGKSRPNWAFEGRLRLRAAFDRRPRRPRPASRGRGRIPFIRPAVSP